MLLLHSMAEVVSMAQALRFSCCARHTLVLVTSISSRVGILRRRRRSDERWTLEKLVQLNSMRLPHNFARSLTQASSRKQCTTTTTTTAALAVVAMVVLVAQETGVLDVASGSAIL